MNNYRRNFMVNSVNRNGVYAVQSFSFPLASPPCRNAIDQMLGPHPSLDAAYPLHDIFRRHKVEQQLSPIFPSSVTDIVGDYTSQRDCPVLREINHMREHQHKMSPQLVAFMERAYSLIARSNASHGPNAPAAVILQAVSDKKNAFTSMKTFPNFTAIAKTHYVVLQVIGTHERLGTTLNEIHTQLGNRPIMALIIRAHGSPTTLQFSDTNRYSIENVCAEDFACLHPKASIIFDACLAGKQLAKKIALVQSRPVFANIDNSDDTFFTPCCTVHGYGMVAFRNDNMVTRRLQQNDETIPCIATRGNIEEIKNIILLRLMQSAQQGNAVDQYDLGVCYWEGLGVTQSYKTAVKWFRQAAAQGQAHAQSNLGVCYSNGIDVTQSYETAIKWFRQAAAQGLADAQFNLGVYYENGTGVTQSYEIAAGWYMQAAVQGDADAQFNLGNCYASGRGVARSYREAAFWYTIAAEQGHTKARDYFNVPLSTKLYRIGVDVLNALRCTLSPVALPVKKSPHNL